jgi:hypothetical protein
MIRSLPARSALLIPLFALSLAACSAAAPAAPTAPAGGLAAPAGGPSAPTTEQGAPAVDLAGPALPPTPVSAGSGSGSSGSTGSGAAGSAVAYPYPILGGSAGLAPDHELVVNGSGQATVKADLSNEASAQRTALAAAIADAKAQAQAAASDAGVTLGGVVSMSVQTSGFYGGDFGTVPMGAGSPSEVAPSNGTTIAPAPPATITSPAVPTTEQLQVTVTVAYTIS